MSYDRAAKRLVLPIGRGRKSLVFNQVDLDFDPGAVKLVWNEQYELHNKRSN